MMMNNMWRYAHFRMNRMDRSYQQSKQVSGENLDNYFPIKQKKELQSYDDDDENRS